ncbi:hypothetical protein GMORB2_0892 [Geosmithia morbida]|uniref:Clr5 domain-containing protein n=1 Tax=Geosmithia morbida TaxID=1094350 RepID=A0A9P4YYY0_9HYPO|nr:uncharacterized protein GMORB2_0892 [Geosmithia morbida]KAF4125648.1 hypothetical protein GMORB2_0892 [Geosmithia morbida]
MAKPWESHRGTITRLYIDDKLTLNERFDKWGLHKYKKASTSSGGGGLTIAPPRPTRGFREVGDEDGWYGGGRLVGGEPSSSLSSIFRSSPAIVRGSSHHSLCRLQDQHQHQHQYPYPYQHQHQHQHQHQFPLEPSSPPYSFSGCNDGGDHDDMYYMPGPATNFCSHSASMQPRSCPTSADIDWVSSPEGEISGDMAAKDLFGLSMSLMGFDESSHLPQLFR